MPVSLSAFAPLRVIDHQLLDGTGVLTTEATTLFVDLVGFTPLTDQLGRFGSRGTEQLSEILQGFFGSVTEQALRSGGDPVAYGGDALTIVFDGGGAATVRAARELGASIQQLSSVTTGTVTLAGALSVHTRIGIARGTVTTTVIHGNARSLPLQLGTGLDRAVDAESQAEVGQVVCHESAVDAAAEGSAATAALVTGSVVRETVKPESLARLIHPTVLRHLLADSSLWQSHRAATVAFIGFPAVMSDAVDDFVRTASRLMDLVDECGGEVVQISGGDKGVVALTVFGAPIGHDDDPVRALQALLEFRRLVPSVRVGITTGPVFTTWLGSDRRRFQAHFGGVMNLAARLMQAAQPREILVDEVTWRDAGMYLRQRGGPRQIHVKGHAEPLEVRDVVGWRRRRRRATAPTTTSLVGRDAETDLIEQLLDAAQSKRGGALTFTGDPGIGKSRLAKEALARARVRGMQVLEVDAEDYPHGQLTGLWREVVGQRLGITPSAKRAEWQTALGLRLSDRAVRLDVLDPVLGLRRGHRPGAPVLEPGMALELAQALIARLVVESASGEPTLIIIENAHQFPEVSRLLLTHLQHRVTDSAIGLLVTERTQPIEGASTDDRGGSIRQLVELSEAAATVLTEEAWRQAGGGTPPPWLASKVFERAGGNPLFLLTATRGMASRWRPGDPPPDIEREGSVSLTSVLTERIDLLDAEQRQVMAVLAVARRPCRLATTVDVLAGRVDAPSVRTAFQHLQDGNFIRLVTRADGERYRLRHDLMRRVVYEQMSHADRVRLHRSMAELLVGQGGSPGEIADHVRHLDDANLGRTWYPLAAAEARDSWSVASAIEWWQMAQPLLEGRERTEAEVELLELFVVGGRAAEVLTTVPTSSDLPSAGQRVLSVDDLDVRRKVAVAEAAFSCGDFARCEAECSAVMAMTEGRDEGRYQRAAELLVRSMCDRGAMTEAVTLARTQLKRAEQTADPSYLTTANASLGAALLLSGDPSVAARHYEAALVDAEATGDTIHQIHALSDLAGCAYALDDYPRCLVLLEQARALAESIGYRQHLLFSLINESQLRAGLGDPQAASRAHTATQRAFELGDLASAAEAFHTWLMSDVQLTANIEAWQRLSRANERLGRTLHVAECYANLAVAAARLGDARAVHTASQHVRSHPEVTPGSTLDRRVELATVLLAAFGLPEGVGTERLELARTLETLSSSPDVSDVERAELLVSAWQIAPDEPHHARAVEAVRAAFDAEPSALVRSWFGELGMEQPPDRHRLPPPIGIAGEDAGTEELDAALSALEAALDARSGD